MDFGSKIVQLRKDKSLSRDDLAKAVGTSSAIIGRYERNEITPSVEVAAKIADALDVSLDYLVGASSFVVKDKKMLHRLELLEKIEDDDRETILKVVDNYLTSAQLQTTTKKLKQKKIKMKAYTAVQKKLLEIIYVLWKKGQSFDPDYQDKLSRELESEPSFTSVPKEPNKPALGSKEVVNPKSKVVPDKTRTTQDKHPSKYRRMPSFT